MSALPRHSEGLRTGCPRSAGKERTHLLRVDGRTNGDLRPVELRRAVAKFAEGSCLIDLGDTRVHCTASVEDRVPPHRVGAGGWVTAEYSMLPRAGHERSSREAARGRQEGRTMEIQRLIGRSLRAVCNLDQLGERTIILDCDVLQADGGTRTAAITAAYVALAEACAGLVRERVMKRWPLLDQVAAISVGIVSGEKLVDLCYQEDSRASTDMNVVAVRRGGLIEVQATAEASPIPRSQFDELLSVGLQSMVGLFEAQEAALKGLEGMP
ncbi:MAG: ribonuclease PH [Armatimonadetes bacterium]|nr:ribonuclease PH [Armatimonadota bacterium]